MKELERTMTTAPQNEIQPKFALLAGGASIVTVAILIVAKSLTYWQSGSVSVLASLTDSGVDAAVSLINFFAIYYAIQPADREHRYGHGKAEGLAALAQGVFIAGAGFYLVMESVRRFTQDHPVQEHWAAIGIMGFSIAISMVLVAIQNHSLKHAPSLAVEAEKAHYAMDIVINGGVIVVLLALLFGAPPWIDPLFALLVAIYLGKTAWDIVGKGLDMLLDRELSDESRLRILDIIRAHPDAKNVHDLRTRKSGMNLYISFDLEIDPDFSLRKAHAISLDIEKGILKEFPNAEVMIHKDPHGIPHDESRHQITGVHDS